MRLSQKTQRSRNRSKVNSDGVKLSTYYRSGNPDTKASPFVKKPKKGRFKLLAIKGVDVVALIVIFGLLCYSLLLSNKPITIVNTNAYHARSAYQDSASKVLSVIQDRNKITFDEKQLIKSLKKEYPEITDVSVELPLFSPVPTVRITAAVPSFVLNSNGQLYVVSSSGKAVAMAANVPASKDLVVVNDETGFRSAVGKQVLSSEGIVFLNSLLAQAKRSSIPIQSIILPPKAQEIHLKTTDRPYYVKFFLDGDVAQQLGQFLAARQKFDNDSQQPSEYLDVRVPGKIYYK